MEPVVGHTCGVIREKLHLSKKVIIACSIEDSSVQVWDLETNEIHYSEASCPGEAGDGYAQFKQLDEYTLVLTNTDDDTNSEFLVYQFDLANYFTIHGEDASGHYQGNSFVAPGGTIECGP